MAMKHVLRPKDTTPLKVPRAGEIMFEHTKSLLSSFFVLSDEMSSGKKRQLVHCMKLGKFYKTNFFPINVANDIL